MSQENKSKFIDAANAVRDRYTGPLDLGTIRKFASYYLGWAVFSYILDKPQSSQAAIDDLKQLSTVFAGDSFGPEFSGYVADAITTDEKFCGDLLESFTYIRNGFEEG